jgi:hypothetical protein
MIPEHSLAGFGEQAGNVGTITALIMALVKVALWIRGFATRVAKKKNGRGRTWSRF